jgi:tRNA(Ile)-lysidine synthase
MGPHPAVAQVRRAVRVALAAAAAERVLVACSGGADSLALAAATAFVAPRAGIAAGLVTIDHGLQPGSAEQARMVAELGYQLGFDPVEVVAVRVGHRGGPEAAAREARYAALAATAGALDAQVLLGHTLDDQAETVLLGLGRGSGPRSIAGMRPVDGRYLRPLLGVRRSVTAQACLALGFSAWHDPHNDDPAYTRVRLRTEVVPLLEEVLAGGVAEALARTAALLQVDLDALDALAATPHLGPSGTDTVGKTPPSGSASTAEVTALIDLPDALRLRVLRRWLLDAGAPRLTAAHLAAVDGLITAWHGQGPIDLPGHRRVARRSGTLVIEVLPAVVADRARIDAGTEAGEPNEGE